MEVFVIAHTHLSFHKPPEVSWSKKQSSPNDKQVNPMDELLLNVELASTGSMEESGKAYDRSARKHTPCCPC
jgi:hypothetical protein